MRILGTLCASWLLLGCGSEIRVEGNDDDPLGGRGGASPMTGAGGRPATTTINTTAGPSVTTSSGSGGSSPGDPGKGIGGFGQDDVGDASPSVDIVSTALYHDGNGGVDVRITFAADYATLDWQSIEWCIDSDQDQQTGITCDRAKPMGGETRWGFGINDGDFFNTWGSLRCEGVSYDPATFTARLSLQMHFSEVQPHFHYAVIANHFDDGTADAIPNAPGEYLDSIEDFDPPPWAGGAPPGDSSCEND